MDEALDSRSGHSQIVGRISDRQQTLASPLWLGNLLVSLWCVPPFACR